MVKETDTTTIQVTWDTHKKLSALKIHPNQSFDEVIQELLQPQQFIQKQEHSGAVHRGGA